MLAFAMLLGLLLAISAAAAGCAPARREVKLGADANGKEIELKKG